MNIVSLLPSATEIIYALGLDDQLVAVTHECDYPERVSANPIITRNVLRQDMTSAEIDAAVRSQLSTDAHTIYTIDRDLLARLSPDLIVTQQLCEVCAVSYDEVLDAIRSLPRRPQVLNLEPSTLSDVLASIQRVGDVTGRVEQARRLVHDLEQRIAHVRDTVTRATTRPRVAFLEWIDPLFCGGHWNPELVELAGGIDGLGNKWQPSTRIEWQQVVDFSPEVLVISCCGFSAERASEDLPNLQALPGYHDLPCVRTGRIHIVDGAAYFSRPGPRLVDSLEILAHFIHPTLFQ